MEDYTRITENLKMLEYSNTDLSTAPSRPTLISPASCVSDPTLTTGNSSSSAEGDDQSMNSFILIWYLQLVYIAAFGTMVVVAAGGNLIVIWIVLGHKRMRTVTNYFLVNLATADVFIAILNTTVNSVYLLHNDWWFGRSYCKFAQFIGPCTISASVFTFMAIAIDR